MGLFGSNDPVKKEEKLLAKGAKHDDKLVKQALKDLAHAEKEEHKAQKAHDHALKQHAKAVTREHNLAEKVNAVVHQHDEALSQENKLVQDIHAREQYHAKIEQEIAAKKKAVEQVTHKHELNDAQRAERHHMLEAAHPTAGAGATTAPSATQGNGLQGEPYGRTAGADGLGTTGPGTGVTPGTTTGYASNAGTVPAGTRY